MPTPPRNAPLSTSTFRSSILRSVRLTALVLFSMGVFTGQALGLEPSGELEIHYINVSQGGSTLVIGPDGTSVLLDMGKRGKGNAAIVPYLMSIGLDPEDGIDFALAGNLDADHIGGFPEITAAGYDIEQGNWFNGSTKGTLTAGRYHDACEATTAGRASVPAVGAVIELGDGARLTVVAAGGYVPGMPDHRKARRERHVAGGRDPARGLRLCLGVRARRRRRRLGVHRPRDRAAEPGDAARASARSRRRDAAVERRRRGRHAREPSRQRELDQRGLDELPAP
ncbi:MAG: ComEC/Rec2 family competence protein [Planctomycetota bacterium]